MSFSSLPMMFFRRSDPYTNLESYEKNLFHLITKKNFDLFRSIMDSQAVDPNIRDHMGNTLLMHSVVEDDFILFTQHLLIKGADLNATDKLGMTAFFKACYWGEVKTFVLLLSKGGKKIDLETTNQAFGFELNPLAASIFKNHVKIAKILLYKGADPFKAEKIIAQNYKIFKDFYTTELQNLINFYKRWHQGKKQFIFARYLGFKRSKKQIANNRSKNPPKKTFRVELLNQECFKIILCEFL